MRYGAPMQTNKYLNFVIIIASILLAIGIAHWMGTQSLPAQTETPELQQAVNFNLPDMNGRKYRLSDYHGQTVVINFWASWCAPCINELPILLSAARSHPHVIFLLISIDEDMKQISRFISRMPPQYQSALEQQNVIILQDKNRDIMQNSYNIDQIPETFILDPDHKIRRHWRGVSFTKNELTQALDKSSAIPLR